MQNVDLTQFPNTSGWKVVHNPNSMTYEIRSDKGHTKPGTYTNRIFAEKALYHYLDDMSKPKKPVGRPPKDVNP